MKKGERATMSWTMDAVLEYLTKTRPIRSEGEYVGYAEIVEGIEKTKGIRRSRHAVAFAVERLCKIGKLGMWDNKLHVIEA